MAIEKRAVVFLFGLLVSFAATSDCSIGGRSCIDSIYSDEKHSRLNRTNSGSILDADLPNNSSIELNVDLSGLARKTELSSAVNSLESRLNSNIESTRDELYQNDSNIYSGLMDEISKLRSDMASMGGAGFPEFGHHLHFGTCSQSGNSGYSWKQLQHASTHMCVLSGVNGEFRGTWQKVRVEIDSRGYWRVGCGGDTYIRGTAYCWAY